MSRLLVSMEEQLLKAGLDVQHFEPMCRLYYYLTELTFVSLTEQEKWFFVVACCLSQVTVAVMKLQGQKQLGEERVYFSHSFM